MYEKLLVIAFYCLCWVNVKAQTLGGNAAFSFSNLPGNAKIAALGGANVSSLTNDVGLTLHNPALLNENNAGGISTSVNSFFAGIKQYSGNTSFFINKPSLVGGVGILFMDYGSIIQTNASGIVEGNFKPVDYLVQFSVAKNHNENWYYGVTYKFMQSSYGMYKSNAMAIDAGVTFKNDEKQWQAALLVKNIGFVLKGYTAAGSKEELPFDIQLGITKRLKKAPFQFSLTAIQLQKLNIYYNDASFNSSEEVSQSNSTVKKVLGHLILGAEVFLHPKFELTAGYNFLRRNDLNVFTTTNGLNGFTAGMGFVLKNVQIRYATGFYQQNRFNMISFNFKAKTTN